VLDGIDLTVQQGSILALLDPNGAGKTTAIAHAAAPAVPDSMARSIHKMKNVIHFVERQPAPSLLPILRSQQQGEILALLLGGPALELSLTEIAARAGAPQSSVHREIERAERAGW